MECRDSGSPRKISDSRLLNMPDLGRQTNFRGDRVAAATVLPDRDHFLIFSLAKCERRKNFDLPSTSLTDR
jgi:hypothetical protein